MTDHRCNLVTRVEEIGIIIIIIIIIHIFRHANGRARVEERAREICIYYISENRMSETQYKISRDWRVSHKIDSLDSPKQFPKLALYGFSSVCGRPNPLRCRQSKKSKWESEGENEPIMSHYHRHSMLTVAAAAAAEATTTTSLKRPRYYFSPWPISWHMVNRRWS